MNWGAVLEYKMKYCGKKRNRLWVILPIATTFSIKYRSLNQKKIKKKIAFFTWSNSEYM